MIMDNIEAQLMQLENWDSSDETEYANQTTPVKKAFTPIKKTTTPVKKASTPAKKPPVKKSPVKKTPAKKNTKVKITPLVKKTIKNQITPPNEEIMDESSDEEGFTGFKTMVNSFSPYLNCLKAFDKIIGNF